MQYGLPVLRGEIVTGELVYLAVLRHYRDLQDGHKRGLAWSPAHAWHCINFVQDGRIFQHIKGPKAGQPLILSPFQLFFTAVFHGWRMAATGLRRFLRLYEQQGRKNGKSTWKAPLALYYLRFCGEPGAEVYCVATTRAQAMTVFGPAFKSVKRWVARSVRAARSIKVREGVNQERIEIGDCIMAPLPANAENLDGLNPSAILYDELHAAPSPDVWNVMESALGARSDPLLSAITTAGYVNDGICTDMRAYLAQILRGERVDDRMGGYICELDKTDDPFDSANWVKANPGLGDAKTWDYMHAQAAKAKALPSAKVNFFVKDLNIWGAGGGVKWFDVSAWDACGKPFDPATLIRRPCFGGLDLASTRDLVAFVLVFPPDEGDDDGDWPMLCWAWVPEAKVGRDAEDDRAPYGTWAKQGHLETTPGDVTDYRPVRQKVLWAAETFDIQELAFDRWNAQQLSNELMDEGIPMVEVPQNTGGMGPGSKQLEKLVYSKRLRHNGHPVLRYCADNVALLFDSNDNFRPDKKASKPNGRIDIVVAAVMALSRAVAVRSAATSAFYNLNQTATQ